jgi:chromosomal replication initiation ATPase DnaA
MADSRQLPLDLAPEPQYGVEDFLVSGSNADAYAMIDAWPQWPGRMLALIGPPASGKSHLAAIWAARSGARSLAARSLAQADVAALAAAGAVAVEDADHPDASTTELFHLLNHADEKQAFLLLTASRPPEAWRAGTPDLASRLCGMPAFAIAEPDDALIRTLFVKLFLDRQLIVDTTLVDYLSVRVERSFAAVRRTVELLDRESLARGKRLSRATAAKMLGLSETSG